MSFFTAPLSEAEHALPPLPLPDIQRTLQKFITSCKPLATQQEIAELERDCELFARTHAPQLQAWLEELQRTNVSWLEGMWEQVAYLSWAEPLAVNSNYASPFPPVTAATPPEARVSQTLSASRAIITCLEFFSQLDAGSLKPDVLAGRSVDWSQYERLFCTTRCALPDSDVMVHHDPRQQQHIVVCAKDRVFALPVKGHSEHALDLALRHIIQLACDDSSRHADALSLPALTALPRRTLGGIVEILKRDKSNAHALDVFEKALFAVCLDDWEEYSYAGHVRQILHGNGRNRVYDKNFQLVIMPSGRLGMNGEHTHSDAPVPARMIEYIGERLHFWTSADSQRYAHSASPPPVATELLLRCTDSTPKSLIAELQSNCESLKTCINVRVIEGKFGIEKLSKELSVSPDAFMQMCIQCAWRKVHGAPVATYETASTRLFKRGRTETIRSCTSEAAQLSAAVCARNYPVDQPMCDAYLYTLFTRALAKHKQLTQEAMAGQGCDRHIMGWRIAAFSLGIQVPLFKNPLVARSTDFRLSTSNVPTKGLGGSFGPPQKNGYGVCYSLFPSTFNVHITQWTQCKETDIDKLHAALEWSISSLYKLAESNAPKRQSKL